MPMPRLRDKRRDARRRGPVSAALVLAAILALGGTATAGPDELKGGSVALKLQNARGLKLNPKSLTMRISGGAVDPISGAGSVRVNGGFRAKRGNGEAKVTITRLTLGANGGPGSISAKVGKKNVSPFATLAGGTVVRNGFGATISNVRAAIARKGAQALNRAFSPKKGKGAEKSARGGVKAGQPLGTIVSITTDPGSVEVVPGTGELVLHTQAVPPGPFVAKLSQHCIDPLPTGTPPGVAPVAPATTDLGGTTYMFPVSGGSAAPDFTAGEVITAGGQTLIKNQSIDPLFPDSCDSAAPPVGTKLVSTEIGVNFANNLLNSTATLPTGASLRAPLATIDFSSGSRSFDSSTNTLSITNVPVKLSFPAALTLNQFFPNQSGDPGNDFVEGDLIGRIDLEGVQLR
jgi:hypothetical protein